MSTQLKQIGGQVRIDTGGRNFGYFDRSQVEVIFNPLSKTVSITCQGAGSINTADVSAGGVLSIETVTGGLVDITSQALWDTNFALLFPNEGGGSGTTPNLQQVTTVGEETDNNMKVYKDTDANCYVEISSGKVEGKKSGLVIIGHEQIGKGTIAAENLPIVSDFIFQLPNIQAIGNEDTLCTKQLDILPLSNYADSITVAPLSAVTIGGAGNVKRCVVIDSADATSTMEFVMTDTYTEITVINKSGTLSYAGALIPEEIYGSAGIYQGPQSIYKYLFCPDTNKIYFGSLVV